ncbi:MAG: hypothetical protein GXP31_14795 [Kiritimatiellaeota bacterium]|nr:hypothetical protein [Kiritimatiellota bacterium]
MPGPLSPEQKAAMQKGRITARKEREQALDVIQNNPQITNVKFWAGLLKKDEELVAGIIKTIDKAKRAIKRAKIKALKAELAALEADK